MEIRAAIIKNGTVDNTVIVNSGDTVTLEALGGIELPVDSEVTAGWIYENNQFHPIPLAPPNPTTPEQNIAAIKAKAGQVILARLPDYKQRNYLARKAELQDILIAGGTLSASEQAEWDFFAAQWAWAKAVRETSNAAELAGTPVDEIVWPI